MTNKQIAIVEEIKQYLPFDNKLSPTDKERLLALDCNFESDWAQTVYDYFYSHTDSDGNVVSLNNFLAQNGCYENHYRQVEEAFVSQLFDWQKPLFFLDVDNTLTNWGELSEQKIDFIKNFDQKHRIILTTGKTYDSIKNVIDDCKLNNNYASCLNGSVLVENGNSTTLQQVGAISAQIVKHFENAPFDTVVYYHDDIRLVKPLSQKNIELLAKYNENYFTEEHLDYSKVVKVLFFIYEGETEKEQLVKDYVKNYPDLVCMRTAWHTYEILRKNQHKGNTVKIISQLMGNYYRTTIGVGDSMNDSQLLNYVGKPFVVATASDELKNIGYPQLEENRDVDIVNLIKQYAGE